VLQLAIFVGGSLFIVQLGLAGAIGGLPIAFLLKDQLHVSASMLSLFGALSGVPLYIKPLLGLLIDAQPIFGSRRRSYLLIAGVMGTIAWLLLGLLPHQFGTLAPVAAQVNLAAVTAGTVLGAIIVEEGQRLGATGRFATLRMMASGLAGGAATIAGGYLTGYDLLFTAAIGASLFALLFSVTLGMLREPERATPRRSWCRQLRAIRQARELWLVLGIFVLILMAPGFGTPLFFFQTNTLHFTAKQIAWMGTIGGTAGGVPGLALYTWLSRRMDARRVFLIAVAAHAATTLLYAGYRTLPLALGIITINAFTGAIAMTGGMDLATRATPRAAAALGFALIASATNVTGALSDLIGSGLYTHWNVTFLNLVWLNAATTALALPIGLLLPRTLTQRREGETPPGSEAPGSDGTGV